jgi:hypothetical protein
VTVSIRTVCAFRDNKPENRRIHAQKYLREQAKYTFMRSPGVIPAFAELII